MSKDGEEIRDIISEHMRDKLEEIEQIREVVLDEVIARLKKEESFFAADVVFSMKKRRGKKGEG